jgi:AcrR family transcriptional regulator
MKKIVRSRKSGKNPQAGKILATAESLFYKFGVRKTTVGDICQAAGISRMTFYKHFRDKVHVAEAVINKLIDEMIGNFRRIMDQGLPYSERVRQFIELKLSKVEGVSASFVQELYGSPYPELHALLRRRLDENLKIALDEYRRAQRLRHIRADVKPEFLVAFLNIMADLVVDERLTRLYSTPKELGAELMNLFFYGILKEERKA